VKTGKPAEMKRHHFPRNWPHFFENRPAELKYRSTKVLGQLYDRVDYVSFTAQYDAPFDERILDAYPGDARLLEAARRLKGDYDTAMRRILGQHQIRTEFEVWSTFVLSKPRVGSDYKQQERVAAVFQALKTRHRDQVYEFLGSRDYSVVAPMVAAMYAVAHEEVQTALAECRGMNEGREPARKMEPSSMPLLSFAWLFPEILGRIAAEARG
jgi:RNA-dependent RNA polymerase